MHTSSGRDKGNDIKIVYKENLKTEDFIFFSQLSTPKMKMENL